MASITSSVSGTTTTYVITDEQGNAITVTAPPNPQVISFSGSGLIDGQQLLTTLMQMLSTGLRPNVILNSKASFSN